MIARAVLATALLCLAFGAPALAAKLKVVASFSILGDMAANVGADHVEVRTLVGPGGDTHAFQPSPSDARAVGEADVVLINGLGFEPWAQGLVASAGAQQKAVVVSEGIAPRRMDGNVVDPHAWQNLANAQIYADNIGKAFARADKANARRYEALVASYVAELDALDAQTKATFGAVPKARRRVITSHDAFGYFGAAYGVTFLAPLGTSTESQASAKSVARLIDQIRRENVTAVFVENVTDPRLIAQIARETGTKIGGELFSDALSKPGGPAATYTDMFRHNVRTLTAAMTASPADAMR